VLTQKTNVGIQDSNDDKKPHCMRSIQALSPGEEKIMGRRILDGRVTSQVPSGSMGMRIRSAIM